MHLLLSYSLEKAKDLWSLCWVLQDCQADHWGTWVTTNASKEWEAELGWPPDDMWTESNWQNGIPGMLVFQVCPLVLDHFDIAS